MTAIQSVTRGAIRRSIGNNLGILIDGVVTSTEDKDTLIDTLNLLGGDDEFNGRHIIIYDATGSIVDGETGVVSDFASATYEATLSANLSANITALDKYEMWKTPWRIADINDAINQAINEVTSRCLQIKETHNTVTETDKYLYNCLDDFVGLYRVDYLYDTGEYRELPIEHWSIAKGATPFLQLTTNGLSLIGSVQLRLAGYKLPSLLENDYEVSEIDPGWLINKVTGELLINHAKSSYLDIHDRKSIGTIRLAKAEANLSVITTNIEAGTRTIN